MKKKILFIIPILLITLCFISCKSCKKDNRSTFEKLVSSIYESETKLAGYNEQTKMFDNDMEIYAKDIDFIIQRDEVIKSEVTINEKKLSTSGTQMYDETTSSYKTVDNKKYVDINGTTYENEYTIPTYYLTFVLSEEFLESGYTLVEDGSNYTLKGKIIDNKASSLFLNKSLGNISNVLIEIKVENNLLTTFKATYTSQNNFKVVIETSYYYAEEGLGKAVFYLEGGECKNSKDRVSYVYKFSGNVIDMKIIDPNVLETDPLGQITKSGYHIEGWYQNKIVHEDGTVEYSDKWDFDTDKMDIKGVTLYAKWEINRVYSYELYYTDKNGVDILLDSYEVAEGEKFYDLFLSNKTVEGYTSLGYLDENKNEWDDSFVHPGGDSDLAIKIYLNLIEGNYTIVSTARQFKTAISRNQNIHLLNDIDFDEDAICFDSYKGIINGNDFKVYNFEIDYDDSRNGLIGPIEDINSSSDHLYISLFFELTDATIKNITFDNIIININTSNSKIKNLIVAPLAIVATNTLLENVTFNATITVTKTPECELEIVDDNFYYSYTSDCVNDESTSINIKK